MNAGKAQFRVIRKDESSWISKEYDSVKDALSDIFIELTEKDIQSILLNYKSADESYLDAIQIKCNRFPRQNGFWSDLKEWFFGK